MSDALDTRGPARRRPAAWQVAAVAVYLLAAGWVVWLSRDQINPDAVAYARLAEHYARGRLDLAVASYWGPLLVWLLTPAVWLGVDPILAAKVLGIFLGLLFALGAADLAGAMRCGPYARWALAPALLMALLMLPEPVTPDLLLTCLLTWYLSATARLLAGPTGPPATTHGGRGPRVRLALAAGMLGGLAYLAKAYALPFVALHLPLTLVLSRVAARCRGPQPARPATLRPLLAGWAGLLLLAGPWIALISHRDGRLTFGGADRLAEPFIVADKARWQGMPALRIQQPRQGRTNVWESPSEIAEELIRPFRLSGEQRTRYRLTAAWNNTGQTLTILRDVDGLGLLLGGWGLTLVLACLAFRLPSPHGALCWWSCASTAVFLAGYAALLVEARYFWPVWGLLLAMLAHALSVICGSGRGADSSQAAGRPEGRWRRLRRAAQLGAGVVLFVLLTSLGQRVWATVRQWARPGGAGDEFAWVRFAGDNCLAQAGGDCRRTPQQPPVAANFWHYGLFTCYRRHEVFLGAFDSRDPDQIASELSAYGPTRVFVFDDDELADRLRSDRRFLWLAGVRNASIGRDLNVLEFKPP